MPNLDSEDVLHALLLDPVANAVCYALELGYQPHQVENAVKIGFDHGITEFEVNRAKRNAR